MIRTAVAVLAIILLNKAPWAEAATPPCTVRQSGGTVDYAEPPPRTLEELTLSATTIVDGYVQSVERVRNGGLNDNVLMLATNVLKGPDTLSQFAIVAWRGGFEMKPGQRYIVFLSQSGAPQQTPFQAQGIAMYSEVASSGRFCVDGSKVRVRDHAGKKHPSDGAGLEKTISEIRNLAGPVQLRARIILEGAPVPPTCQDFECRVTVEQDTFPLAGSITATGRSVNDLRIGPRGDLRIVLKPEIGGAPAKTATAPRQATAIALSRGRRILGLARQLARGIEMVDQRGRVSRLSEPAPLDTRMVRIENNGEFVAGVDQGRYRVAVEDLPFGYWVKSIKYGSSDITREPLNVGVGASSQLEITLTRIPQSPRGVTLSGRVPKIPPEIPAGQTWVTLISNGPEKSRTGAVKLGSDGAFEFKGVPAGNYRLGTIVTAAVNGLTWDRNAAIKVVVMDEDLTMDASIFEGSSVAIRVVDRNGKGIESGPNLSVTFTPLVVGDPIDLIIGGALAVEAPGPTGIPRALLPSGAYDVVVSNDGSRSFQMLSVKSVTSGAVNLRKERLSANGQTPVEPIIITLN